MIAVWIEKGSGGDRQNTNLSSNRAFGLKSCAFTSNDRRFHGVNTVMTASGWNRADEGNAERSGSVTNR